MPSSSIRNITSEPLWLSLNSGASLRLSPGETSGELDDVEITNNTKIEKLQGQRMIAIEQIQRKAPAPEKRRGATHARAEATPPAEREAATPAEAGPA